MSAVHDETTSATMCKAVTTKQQSPFFFRAVRRSHQDTVLHLDGDDQKGMGSFDLGVHRTGVYILQDAECADRSADYHCADVDDAVIPRTCF